jgi:DNA-binding response OmpR family regulator
MASILIVDDDEDIREILKYNLERENHSIRAVGDGLKCLEEVSKEKPDLILLDVMMPGMDGIEVCEQLKSSTENKDILICFLTARSEDYSQIAGLESGGDDYVTKPIKPKVLVSRINALLRRNESRKTVVETHSNELRINREKYLVEKDGKEILVCTVGKTILHYDIRCLEDLHAMLKAHGDWMELGSADEQKPAKEGTVEAWGRSENNPVGGWYGLKKGYRGRFGMYVPPLMEALGLAEVTHDAKGNKMKAI